MSRLPSLLVLLLVLTVVVVPIDVHWVHAQLGSVLYTFDGAPPAPQPYRPTTFDVQRNSSDSYRQIGTEGAGSWIPPMLADHGPHCEPPPAQHPISYLDDAVFICADHVMTAMNAGYGAIYLTPNAQIDFSAGEAVLRWDMSTKSTTGRDWVDLWVTPYAENLAVPLDSFLPPYQGPPRRTVHMRMDGTGNTNNPGGAYFVGEVMRDFIATGLPGAGGHGLKTFLVPDAARRDTFELHISRTHIKFGMPAYNNWWVDATVADLGWDVGIVQLAHHAYNPTKGCDETHDGADPNGYCANTWHWDNISISPSRPFTILTATPRIVDRLTPAQLTFPGAIPQNAYLRFAGHGQALEISADNGASWFPAARQLQSGNRDEHWSTYFAPVPAGPSSLLVRGQASWSGAWVIQDAAVWADVSGPPPPTPTATLVPSATPTPGAIQPQTVTFDDPALVGQNHPLSGQYPAGVIDWGTNQWFLSAPWKGFTTRSVGFNGAGPTSKTFAFLAPGRLVRLDAFNGGTVASTVTLSCSGQPAKTVSVAVNQLLTIDTGWTGTCTTVTISSSNGWDTNFDGLVIDGG